jgi:hypothetical protein
MKPQDLPDNLYFGGGAQETIITPTAIGLFVVCLLLTLILPRKYAIIPFLLGALLIPLQEVIVVAGLHLMIYRLLLLGGWARILWIWLSTGRNVFPKLNVLDKVFLAWAISNATTYVLLWGTGAIVNRLGFLYTTLGAYFWLRYLIRDRDDVVRAIKVLSVATAFMAAGMFVEHLHGVNQFYLYLAGVLKHADIREGRIRAQGPFLHSIIAGTFAAMLVPLFLLLWKERKENRFFSVMGVVASSVIALTCASSTPLMTYAAGVIGLCLWFARRNMRAVRWGIIAALIALQVTMNAPIWFVFARLGGVMGGTGWHRSELIDQFVHRIGDWWLVGARDSATWGMDMWDCIDAYVRAGVDGGLVTFVLFISLIVLAYKKIGRARKIAEHNRSNERVLWAIGASLFANTVAFFGIIYFDQSVLAWYTLLVMISATSTSVIAERRERLNRKDGHSGEAVSLPTDKVESEAELVGTRHFAIGPIC